MDGGAKLIVPASARIGRYRKAFVEELHSVAKAHITRNWEGEGYFYALEHWPYTAYRFPLWYAALVFVLAGVGALRLGRRFTLRSVSIATTVVAGLMGMVVAL